jgi:hypothetical protein
MRSEAAAGAVFAPPHTSPPAPLLLLSCRCCWIAIKPPATTCWCWEPSGRPRASPSPTHTAATRVSLSCLCSSVTTQRTPSNSLTLRLCMLLHAHPAGGGSRTPHATHGPASSKDSDDPTATEDWDSAVGPGSLSAGPSGLDDAFSSFKSRVSSKALGSIAEDTLSAQPSGVCLCVSAAVATDEPQQHQLSILAVVRTSASNPMTIVSRA